MSAFQAWDDFREVLKNINKKGYKDQYYAKSLAELNRISRIFQEEESWVPLSRCYAEIAHLNEKNGNIKEQKTKLLLAARALITAQREHVQSGREVDVYYVSDIGKYYKQAADILIKLKKNSLAGVVLMEVANMMIEFNEVNCAIENLKLAIPMVTGNYYRHCNALYIMIDLLSKVGSWLTALTTVDELWMMVMKMNETGPDITTILKDCEVMTMLILVHMRGYEPYGRHRLLLELYGFNKSRDQTSSKSVSHSEISNLTFNEMTTLKTLLRRIRNNEFSEANSLLRTTCTHIESTSAGVAQHDSRMAAILNSSLTEIHESYSFISKEAFLVFERVIEDTHL